MTQEVLDTIKTLAKDGMTLVIVTHEMSFAREVANRVVFLSRGQIIEEGTPEKMFNSPQSNITREFLKSSIKKVLL